MQAKACTLSDSKSIELSWPQQFAWTVEKGKVADLLLLDANPLEDIANTQRINAVVLVGKLFEKSQLREMLAKVEKAVK